MFRLLRKNVTSKFRNFNQKTLKPSNFQSIVKPINFFVIFTGVTFLTASLKVKNKKKREKKEKSKNSIMETWNSLPESKKTIYSIIAVNSVVFVCL
jgi:hypothetical protein